MHYEPGKSIAGTRHPDAKMVRTECWELTHYPGHGDELYDPAHRQTVNDLKGVLLLDRMTTAEEKDHIARRGLV